MIYRVHGCGFFQVRGGKIVLQRGYWDKLTFLRARASGADSARRVTLGVVDISHAAC